MSAEPGSAGPSAALPALASAVLFGVTTPLAKQLLAGLHPLLVAGLLYAGSGIGLSVWLLLRARGRITLGLTRADVPWLLLSVIAGGVVAPALLMLGLQVTDAATASLLLNLEMVFTALLAWLVFREATGRRVIMGFLFILAGGVLLAAPTHAAGAASLRGLVAILGACLLWGIDNNVTRKISAGDARAIAAIKGLSAGLTSLVLAFLLGAKLPGAGQAAAALTLGFFGYGVSLVLFVQSLRELGSVRTGAYFASAPFIGGALALALYGLTPDAGFWGAAALMLTGVWLHLTERHAHEHTHEELSHTHAHVHDEHHHHRHGPEWDGTEPHVHEHRHEPLRHSHAHFPDIHHRHRH